MTNKVLFICVFAFASLAVSIADSGTAWAQTEVRVKGYLEHQYSVSYNEGNWTHLDYDRARVDVSARAGRGTRISIAPVWQIFRGDTKIPLRDVLPDFLDVFADSATVPIENQLLLNHAYISLRPGPLELTIGKQYLAWGAALVFNPTELFRPKNVLEPGYEREGVGAITARLPLGTLSDVTIGLVPDGRIKESGKLVRIRHHISGFDISALAVLLTEPVLPTTLNLLSPEEQQRVTFGGDITGEILGLGAWAEATWSDQGETQWVEATAGSNYTLASNTTLMIEATYNGRGAWDAPYTPSLWAGRLTGVLRSMSKVVVYGAVFHPVDQFQLWNVGLSGLVSAADGSAVIIPSVSYAFAQDVDLLFNALVYAGEDGSEYAGRRFGAFIRARVYF
ncbi:MAG: hypothetical protein AB8G77_28395 [Rhodothermales bacterium]